MNFAVITSFVYRMQRNVLISLEDVEGVARNFRGRAVSK